MSVAGARVIARLRLHHLLSAALLAWVCAAPAQTITVTPVRVAITAAEPVAVLTLRNDDPTGPTLIQARASAWAVQDGEDRYQTTRDLVVSPTVFKLQPGQEQVVRIALRGKPDERVERAFRVFLQQLQDEEEQQRRKGNVRFLFTVGIPVLVAPSANANPQAQVDWRVERSAAGGYRLRARNDGTAHQKVVSATLNTTAGEIRVFSAATYLLPGSERAWSFSPAAPLPPGPVSLTLTADDGSPSIVRASQAE